MGISYKILLDKRRTRSSGEYPLIVRIYQGSATKEHSLKIKIKESEWEEETQTIAKSNPNSREYNAKILSVKSKLQKTLVLSDLNEDIGITLEDVVTNTFKKVSAAKPSKASIIDYGLQQVALLKKNGKAGNSIIYSCAINKLHSFVKTRNFPFEDLTYKKLNEFRDAMEQEGIKTNSISVYFRTIRAIYNKAIREGLVSQSNYPFSNYKIKSEKTPSRALSLDDFKNLVNADLPANTPIWHWRNYFLLSFCLIGVNFADLLTFTDSNIVDGRVTYRRKKTGKIYSVKMHPEVSNVLSMYKGTNKYIPQLLFPIIKVIDDPMNLKKDILQAVKTCNAYLRRIGKICNINKDITTYSARYTWANIAKSLGYSKDMIAEALGHEYGNRVTGIYLDNYENDIIDKMNFHIINEIIK